MTDVIDEIKAAVRAVESGEQPKQLAGEAGRQSRADRLVELALAVGCELWHGPDQDAYVTVLVGDHAENYSLQSKGFRAWLEYRLYEADGKAAGDQAVQAAIASLAGRARFSGLEHKPFTRVAGHDGRIYVDLGHTDWSAVEIDPSGWRIVARPPVRFIRSKSMRPLPLPVRGGSVDDLRDLLNLGTDQAAEDRFTLIVASLVAALRPKGPYPVTAINGEQGCGKSMAVKILRMLIDPNETLVRAAPREERDLIAAAVAGWVITLGNLSFIPEWLSDALCRLSTGEGYAARPLFANVTDADEVTFRGQRVIMLEGIPTLLGRPDLADRAMMITLEPIAGENRTTEEELWTRFTQVAPGILGALYDAVAHGLRELPNTKLKSLPRMADFALWATACEGGLGWERGRFMAAYDAVKVVQAELAVEGDAVALALLDFLEDPQGPAENGAWKGRVGDLFRKLEFRHEGSSKGWPETPRSFGDRLRRLAPALRIIGIQIVFDEKRTKRGYGVHVFRANDRRR